MAEEIVRIGAAEESAPRPAPARRRLHRSYLWWTILAVYAGLFLTTAYLTFLRPESNPALGGPLRALAGQTPDGATREFLMEMLQAEANEHHRRAEMAGHAFNIVLGALLGFLSASLAEQQMSRRGEQ
ncbi:MAG TPA: hypothetical protein VF263_22070 [Longimicrobiaceae bacterium]